MSAWKPTASGLPTRSSTTTIVRQECIPPQPISPPAATRSPAPPPTLPPSPHRSATRFSLPPLAPAHSPGGPVRHPGEGVAPCLLDLGGGAAPPPPLSEDGVAPPPPTQPGPPAGRRPDRGHHRADHQPARPDLVGQCLELIVGRVDV